MSARRTLLVFPHQLFDPHPGLESNPDRVALVEDSLFFGDPLLGTQMHKQKLWLHRASMQRYEQTLRQSGFQVDYVDHQTGASTLEQYLGNLPHASTLVLAEPHDDLLIRRLRRYCKQWSLKIEFTTTPMFLNSSEDNRTFRASHKRWAMSDFYKHQRRRFDILMEGNDPVGGKWNFDQENRKKVPKGMLGNLPALSIPEYDAIDRAAREHILARYADHPGSLDSLYFPTSHKQAISWLDDFLENRFSLFGDYEDAMVEGQKWLWHSVLTPMLNTGLLTPRVILDRTVRYADRSEVPLNALEGFIRQVIGWREFMRATYDDLGVSMRTTNHWGHRRRLPASFYEGTTGVLPVDDVIERVRASGYCHHIERLMVLGGFMFLCEIDPDDIYRWFMEMFVDSYDWVMVPNVYAMSQHADGGQITTKPYFSGSSYIRKMSNYPPGEWAEIWDGLYWRWIWKHREKLAKNPRWAMMCAMVRKMDRAKRTAHLQRAEQYLQRLDASLPRDVAVEHV
ncbi:MAG: cryptochrome/photolyase family protein [Pirellulales bacterium]|nr:cryptochrome/photolyase family protein [Pirellulales bacterium]